jgi:phospholipid transport system substrate-binding protein
MRTMIKRGLMGVVMQFALWSIAHAEEGPSELIQRVTQEVMDAVQHDTSLREGNTQRIRALIEEKIVPHLDFERTTALATGRFWKEATESQKQALQNQFKTLLMRTYSSALTKVKDQPITYDPIRTTDKLDVILNAHAFSSQGQPIDFGYRLRQHVNGWKVYDVNVLGVWMVQVYRESFAHIIKQSGIDGLIQALTEKNQTLQDKDPH